MRTLAAVALGAALSVSAVVPLSISGAAPAMAQGTGPDRIGPPSGTLTMSAHAAALGVGYTWGDGALRYRGHTYHFSVKGISIADVGLANITSRGRVYNLKQVSDFSGTYGAVSGEATAGTNGIGGQILRNANGVQIRIDQTARGARLDGSADGIQLTLK